MGTAIKRRAGTARATKLDSCGASPGQALFELFRVLGDPNRVALLQRLIACSPETQTVSDLAPCCPVDFSVVSRHLRLLREAGVIEATKVGKHVFYGVRSHGVASKLRELADVLDTCCEPRAVDAAPKQRSRVGRAPGEARRAAGHRLR